MKASAIDIQPILNAVLKAVEHARIGAGRYRRWLGGEAARRKEGDTPNPYGCADAANILYTLGLLPGQGEERSQFVQVLQTMQDRETGLFQEDTHHPYHVTAHCCAALELFDAVPEFPLRALAFLDAPGSLEAFLDGLEWESSPWNASHKGAGVYAARVICREATPQWQGRYFSWLAREQCPATGFWRKGFVAANGQVPLFHHLAGTFHYLFNHEWARQPLRYPQRMVDTCLEIFATAAEPSLGRTIGFAEIDWVYCLTRATRQCGYRYAQGVDALWRFAQEYCAFLTGLVDTQRIPFEDLHALFGSLCALAELQVSLPGLLHSDRPLRLVLDRRPFI